MHYTLLGMLGGLVGAAIVRLLWRSGSGGNVGGDAIGSRGKGGFGGVGDGQ
jgi:hypothetical protein